MFIRGEEVNSLKKKTEAEDGRDALAKALYARMFGWIVGQINNHLQAPDKHRYATTAADDILIAFFIFFSEKIRRDISYGFKCSVMSYFP